MLYGVMSIDALLFIFSSWSKLEDSNRIKEKRGDTIIVLKSETDFLLFLSPMYYFMKIKWKPFYNIKNKTIIQKKFKD